MKNLKYLLLVLLGVSFLSLLVYTLDFKQSQLEFAHSTSHHKVYSQSKNYERTSILKQSSWDTHFTSHVNLKQKVSSQGIKRLKAQKSSSILKLKSSALRGSDESMMHLKNNPLFVNQIAHKHSSVSTNFTPENVRFQSLGEASQMIAQNTFDMPMQFSGPPSGGGLGALDDPAMPLEGDFLCFSFLLFLVFVYKTYRKFLSNSIRKF